VLFSVKNFGRIRIKKPVEVSVKTPNQEKVKPFDVDVT
jgi:hypothetical protein